MYNTTLYVPNRSMLRQLLLKCLAASRDMLFWSFLLLTFVQCVAGMVVTTLCWQFIQDESQEVQLRDEVFRYYGA